MAGKLAQRSQAERTAVTRADLLRAAERVIAERGFDAASLAEIAAGAGVSKGAIYHHFAAKEDLLFALLDAHFHERIEAVERIVAGPPDGVAARVTGEIPFDRRWNLLFLEFVIRAARDDFFGRELRKRIADLRVRSAQAVGEVLESQRLGSDLSPEELATIVAALGNGLAIEGLIDRAHSPDVLYTASLELLLHGVTAQDRAARRRGRAR